MQEWNYQEFSAGVENVGVQGDGLWKTTRPVLQILGSQYDQCWLHNNSLVLGVTCNVGHVVSVVIYNAFCHYFNF